MTTRGDGPEPRDPALLPANMLHAFLDSAVDIIACHGRDYRFIYVNRAVEAVTGIPPSACIGHTALEAGIPEHLARAFDKKLDEVFARGARTDFELEFPSADGPRSIHMRLTPEVGPDGIVRTVVSVSRDVTERKRMEQALAQSEARYRSVVEDQTEVVSRLRPDGTLTFVNDVYCRLFGRSRDALLGTKWNPVAHPEDIPRIEAEVQGLSPDNQVVVIENRVFDADGRQRWMEFVNRGLFDERGDLLEIQSVGRDIDARKKMEAERQAIDRKLQETQKLESLGVLAGGIAHDFNNLLTGILGNASLARLVLPNHSPALEALDEIEKASLRAADLCRQMLAYAGKGRLMTEPIELSKLVEDSAPLLKVFISKKAVLHFDLATSLPIIIGDATQIRQILMNIVINASDAIGDRSGRIIVSTGVVRTDRAYLRDFHAGADLAEGDYVFLEVTDNGCGMSKDTLTRIFEPFFTTKFTGRGLGLSAVLGIVQSHSAGIKIYSEVGKGTSFKLIFPCAQEQTEKAAPSPLDIEPYRGEGLVLVVDDEETVRAVTARILESAGFRVALAGDGREGVEQFRRDPAIRLVLLDLTMPRLSGEDAFRELRTIREGTPVILMSGYSPEELKIQFAGKGLAGYLRKPFRPSELLSAVKEALERERERRRPVSPG